MSKPHVGAAHCTGLVALMLGAGAIGGGATLGCTKPMKPVGLSEPRSVHRRPAKEGPSVRPCYVLARGYDVQGYKVKLSFTGPDPKLTAHAEVEVLAKRGGLKELVFDSYRLSYQGVKVNGKSRSFKTETGKVKVSLKAPPKVGDTLRIAFDYEAKAAPGLHFNGSQVYGYFFTPAWLPSVFDPVDKAPIEQEFELPAPFEVVANGEPLSEKAADGQRKLVRWKQSTPNAAYLYGFAFGKLVSVASDVGGLRVESYSGDLSPATERKLSLSLSKAVKFFTDKAGVAYPDASYRQVFIPNAPTHPMAGMTMLGYARIEPMLGAKEGALPLVEALASQWWGNVATPESWSELWLGTGLASYMGAAYQLKTAGHTAYEEALLRARMQVATHQARMGPQPLVFSRWTPASDIHNGYLRGWAVMAMHTLRKELGEKAFWNGIRRYTQEAQTKPARTRDLQRAMEHESGKELGEFFQQWVYSHKPLELHVNHRVDGGVLYVDVEQKQKDLWALSMVVAVETDTGRQRQRLELRRRRSTLRYVISGRVHSVVANEFSLVPGMIDHHRNAEMLLYQVANEQEVHTRLGALEALVALCKDPHGDDRRFCAMAHGEVKLRAKRDRSALLRARARQLLKTSPWIKPASSR